MTQTVGWMDDSQLPQRYQLGLTNLVARPSRSSSEIRAAEFRAGRPVLDAKIRLWRPLVVCFIGKGIFEHWAGRACTTLGRQPETIALPGREEAAPDEMATAHAAAMSTAEVHMAESLPAHECITAVLGAHTDAHALDAPTAARVARRRSALTYAMPSTSARVAGIAFTQKLTYFQQLCQLVEAEEAREQAEPTDLSYN